MKLRSGLLGCKQSGVAIYRRSKVGDGHGGEVDKYVEYVPRWRARVYRASGQTRREDIGIVWMPTHQVQGVPVDLQVDDRIVDGNGDVFEVRFVHARGGYHNLTDTMLADLVQMTQMAGT